MSLFLVIFVKYFGEVLITIHSPLLETHFFQSLLENLCKIAKWLLNSVVHAHVYTISVVIKKN